MLNHPLELGSPATWTLSVKMQICCFVVFNKKHIPLSGRNPVFQETLNVRPHLLILNKMDLADTSNKKVSLALISTLTPPAAQDISF